MNKTSGRKGFAANLIAMGAGCLLSAGIGAAPPPSVPAGGTMGDILAKLDEISRKLDKVEKRLGCPIDDYVAGTCTDSPAAATVTYCIAQGRGLEVGAKFAVEPKLGLEAGLRWDVGPLGDVKGTANWPIYLPLTPLIGLPIPTEIALGASGSHGKGFDICIEVPLRAAEADAQLIERIVRGMNPPAGAGDTKYQRRLTRLLNFADRRVPEPTTTAAARSATVSAEDVDLDDLDDAMDRFMAGELQPFSGPVGLFKDPVVQRMRNALDLPEPVHQVFDDPELIFAVMPTMSLGNPAQICDTFGLSGNIASRFPAVGNTCNLLRGLPSFETTSRSFETVHRINSLLADLPDEIIFGVADILPEVNAPKLPAPRPPGSPICSVFPRLCR